jgi:predicted nucleic acid-binding protein
VRFWDTSAVVPLLVEQGHSAGARALATDPGDMVVWWGTVVECLSGLARLRVEGALSVWTETRARESLTLLGDRWVEVVPSNRLRAVAGELVSRHLLRAGDALQLAAALEWAGDARLGRLIVTFDRRLRHAAAVEGFTVLPEEG